VAQVTIEDGIIRVKELDIQDGKAARVLAEYPEARWAEITRRALKIGLGYLQEGHRISWLPITRTHGTPRLEGGTTTRRCLFVKATWFKVF
jgi:hypothetical protein